jgi:hypothetical protein
MEIDEDHEKENHSDQAQSAWLVDHSGSTHEVDDTAMLHQRRRSLAAVFTTFLVYGLK